MTAHEESAGKLPLGATRTRTMPSRNAVMRTLASPAVSSRPSESFSTCCTFPRCCQPCAPAAAQAIAENRNPAKARCTNANIIFLQDKPGAAGPKQFSDFLWSGRQPLLEERGRFGALDAPAHCVHHPAADDFAGSVKPQPVRQVHQIRLTRELETLLPHFEK